MRSASSFRTLRHRNDGRPHRNPHSGQAIGLGHGLLFNRSKKSDISHRSSQCSSCQSNTPSYHLYSTAAAKGRCDGYDSLERTSFSSASSSFVEEGVGIHAAHHRAATWSARNFSLSSLRRAYHTKTRNQNKLKPSCITFLTDVEGDGDYFDRFVRHSKVLGFRSRKPSFGNYGPVFKNDVNVKWNLGEVDDDYFPYDKEVIFLEDEEFTTNSKGGEKMTPTMLVYGVSLTDFVLFRTMI